MKMEIFTSLPIHHTEQAGFGFYHHSNQLPLVGSPRASNWKSNRQVSNFVTLTSLEAVWSRIRVIATIIQSVLWQALF